MCRAPTRPIWLLAALALGSFAGPLWLLDRYDLASQFADDAFYYFQIAHNVSRGLGTSFDGIHATNGFHPLWLFSLVPIFAFVPGLDAPVRAAGTLEAVLIAWTAICIYRGLYTRTSQRHAVFAALLFLALPGARGVLRTGLEGALSVALLASAWLLWLRRNEPGASAWKLGIVLGLLTLTRIEGVLGPLAIVLADRKTLVSTPRFALGWMLPSAAALLGLSSWNLARYGVPFPISGMVKHVWALQGATLGPWLPRTGTLIVLGAAVLSLSAMALLRRWPRVRERLHALGGSWLLLGAGAMLAADLLATGSISSWYLAPIWLGATLSLSVLLEHTPRMHAVASALLIALALARVPWTLRSVHGHVLQAHLRGEAADRLRARTAPSARIGAWNGGMLGYYSGRHVIMLDGLANDAAFYRRVIVGGDLVGYLYDERIDALAVTGCTLNATMAGIASARDIIERRYPLHTQLAREPSQHGACSAYELWQMR